jgi:hypothetical protein
MGMPCSERSFRDKKRYFFYLLAKNKKTWPIKGHTSVLLYTIDKCYRTDITEW